MSANVGPEAAALIARGSVESEDLEDLRLNQHEREALIPALSDAYIVEQVRHVVKNCRRPSVPAWTYDDALQAYALELASRLENRIRTKAERKAAERKAAASDVVGVLQRWHGGRPQRAWEIRTTFGRSVLIEISEGIDHVSRAVTSAVIENAVIDILSVEAEIAMAMLADRRAARVRQEAQRCLCGGVGCNACEPQGRG